MGVCHKAGSQGPSKGPHNLTSTGPHPTLCIGYIYSFICQYNK